MSGPFLRTKPKFNRLPNLLGVSPQTARGLLEFLWDSVYDTGDANIGDADAVEAAAGWTGEPGKFCEALLACGGKGKAGFIEEIPDQPGTYRLHDLMQHASPERVRVWSRQQERAERGSTLSEVRRAAANVRWAKKYARDAAAHGNGDANNYANRANGDAKVCKPMQNDAVCMPLHACTETTDACQPVAMPIPPTTATPPPMQKPKKSLIPNLLEIADYFREVKITGDPQMFLAQYHPVLPDPDEPLAKAHWKSAADEWFAEIQQRKGYQPYVSPVKRLWPVEKAK